MHGLPHEHGSLICLTGLNSSRRLTLFQVNSQAARPSLLRTGRSAKALCVRNASNRQILRKRIELLDGAIEQIEFQAKSWATTFRQSFHQIVEHGAQAARDLKVLRPVKTNFPASELHEIIPIRTTCSKSSASPRIALVDQDCKTRQCSLPEWTR